MLYRLVVRCTPCRKHCTKTKVSQETTDLVTFMEEIHNGKLFCAVKCRNELYALLSFYLSVSVGEVTA